MYIIGIDPGKHTGIARIDNNKGLIEINNWAEIIRKKGESEESHANRVLMCLESKEFSYSEKVIIEKPQFRANSPCRIEDIMSLSYFTGLIAGKIGEVTRIATVTPLQWKGAVKKKIHNDRVAKMMMLPSGLSDHVIDAYGLALYGATGKRI